ncbi:hypothetical protein ACP70R_027079 [Stipagrostis hirtigluma subsp. patula]
MQAKTHRNKNFFLPTSSSDVGEETDSEDTDGEYMDGDDFYGDEADGETWMRKKLMTRVRVMQTLAATMVGAMRCCDTVGLKLIKLC